MKKMGLFGVAVAATCMGEVTLAWSRGSATARGKLFDPFGYGGAHVDCGGSHAGGAGSWLVCGDQVIGTAGVDGYDGCAGGAAAVAVFELLEPQPTNVRARKIRKRSSIDDTRKPRDDRIYKPPNAGSPHAGILGRKRRAIQSLQSGGLKNM